MKRIPLHELHAYAKCNNRVLGGIRRAMWTESLLLLGILAGLATLVVGGSVLALHGEDEVELGKGRPGARSRRRSQPRRAWIRVAFAGLFFYCIVAALLLVSFVQGGGCARCVVCSDAGKQAVVTAWDRDILADVYYY